MPRALSIILGAVIILAFLGVMGWLLVRAIRRSEDPVRVLVKTVATFIIAALCGWALFSETGYSFGGAFVVPFIAVVLGLIGSVIWAPHLGALLAKPLTAMFDGGSQELEPQPLYSRAIAKRKAGKYQESIYGILEQLEKFPNDVEGQLLLAEIQAEDLHDLQAAELTVQRFCEQRGHAPENIALALTQLADWHLKQTQDVEAARRALQRILELLPNTRQEQAALQRLAHLADTAALVDAHDRAAIPLPQGVQNVGLLKDSAALRRPEEDMAETAAALVRQLEAHPYDAEAREKLAGIYADYYQRLDLAAEQLEQLILQPHQPEKLVARWLGLLADFQLRHGCDYQTVSQTLQRIVDTYPGRAVAETARQRIDHLRLEFKAREKSQALQLGSYEQNLGLKKRPGSK